MDRQTGSCGMVGCSPLQYIDGLQSGGAVMKSKSDEQLHCFPQTFSEDKCGFLPLLLSEH